jgi:LAO/AO transport system kinase
MLQLGQPSSRIYQRTVWQHHGIEDPQLGVVPDNDQSWVTPIIRTVATEGSGIDDLYEEITRHRLFLEGSGELTRRERARLQAELDNLLQATLVSRWRSEITERHYRQVLDKLVTRSVSPWQAVELMLDGDK